MRTLQTSKPVMLVIAALSAATALACGSDPAVDVAADASQISANDATSAGLKANRERNTMDKGRPRGAPDPAQMFAHFDQDGDGKVAVSELPERAQQRLRGADTNQDGTLTLEEMKAHHEARRAEFLKAADTNGDGKLSDEERRASGRWGKGGKHGPNGRGAPPDPARMFAHLDQDGDGRVAVSDLPPRAQEKLQQADSNQDGSLTLEEVKAHHEARRAKFLQEADADGDGKISEEEHRALQAKRHAERFAAADQNQDGSLTESEVAPRRWQHLSQADVNDDGKVTLAEIQEAIQQGKLRPQGPHGGRGPGGQRGGRNGPNGGQGGPGGRS